MALFIAAVRQLIVLDVLAFRKGFTRVCLTWRDLYIGKISIECL